MKVLAVIMRVEKFEDTWKWFLNQAYIQAIEHLDWALFPICNTASLQTAVSFCNALLIPGGYDVQSYYFKQERDGHILGYDAAMDHFEFACIQAFIKKQLPILGICRGMQSLNVYFKGTLLQHIDTKQHALHHHHVVHVSARSFLKQLYPDSFTVNSYHHQVIGRLAKGFISSALSDESYVEAIEHKSMPILGVQWHPELLENDQILPYFLDVVCA